MGALIDDISRAIASSVSRREAFKMVTGSVGGAVLASLGFGRAARAQGAQDFPCPERGVFCNVHCYPRGSTCCGDRIVCFADQTCCSNTHCCDNSQNCCGASCCPKTRNCCNGACCRPFSACCGGKTCCPPGFYCCGTECQRERPSPSSGCIPVGHPLGAPF